MCLTTSEGVFGTCFPIRHSFEAISLHKVLFGGSGSPEICGGPTFGQTELFQGTFLEVPEAV